MSQSNLPLNVESLDFSAVLNPNCTYFNTSDVTPVVDGDTLKVINGRGASRSWGSPNVTSAVTPLNQNVIMVEVTGWHKWTISPVGGNFYFVNEGGQWVRRRANHKVVKAALAQ